MKKKIVSLYDDVISVYKNKVSHTNINIKEDLPNVVKQIEILVKPDFIFVMDLRNQKDSLVFEKNYTLKSDKGEVTIDMIMGSLQPEHLEKILEIDKISAMFTAASYKYPFQYLMNVGFPIQLTPGNLQYLLRTAMVISTGEDGLPYHALAYIRDITTLCKNKQNLDFYISGGDDNNEEILTLKEELTSIININLLLTRQEKRIIKLIEQGKTSQDIADELFISKSTVDTHRQNIIKKLEVKNSAAAVTKAISLGIIE